MLFPRHPRFRALAHFLLTAAYLVEGITAFLDFICARGWAYFPFAILVIYRTEFEWEYLFGLTGYVALLSAPVGPIWP